MQDETSVTFFASDPTPILGMRYVGVWHLADELKRGPNAQRDGLTGSIAGTTT